MLKETTFYSDAYNANFTLTAPFYLTDLHIATALSAYMPGVTSFEILGMTVKVEPVVDEPEVKAETVKAETVKAAKTEK